MKITNKNLRDKALYDGKDVFPLYVHTNSNYNDLSITEVADLRYIEPISELTSLMGYTATTTYVETVFNDKEFCKPYTTVWGNVNSIKDSKSCLPFSKIAISTKQPRD